MRGAFVVAATLGAVVAAQQTVQVGPSGSFTFSPNTLTAQPGETIMFNLVDPIHTVTQAAGIDSACVQSGFSSNLGDSSFQITVNDTKPIYIFCGPHCTFGMVMIINPANSGDVAAFGQVATGGPPPATSGGASSPAAGASTTDTNAPAPSSTDSTSPSATGSTNAPGGAASSNVPSFFGALVGLALAAFF
ncbi:hypothetical protein EXIGLDRAFT_753572 [Exidia glandulosa HHB12029]|uniref:Blue (type 1) copper domain-containing protein n=1 Tax=Exidia glandulosa HHB12029 TaxID=1314781 RepID=A0A165DMP4_EXIGL|nr:hypothetical protein EXIGLDRAFT_753572 [Exidia glandulosa HHB12029]